MGRWRGAAVTVCGLVLLSGCAADTPGTAQTQGYRPLPAASVSAAPITLGEHTLAVSPDGTRAVVRVDRKWCVLPVATPTDPATGVCPVLPTGASVGTAAFSPDGTRVAMSEDYARTFRGRLWIVDAATGSALAAAAPGAAGGVPSSGAPSSAASSSGGLRATIERYAAFGWNGTDGALVAVEFGPGKGAPDVLVRVDPATGSRSPITELSGSGRFNGYLAVGGGAAAVGVQGSSGRQTSVSVVTLADGSQRSLDTELGPVLSPDATLAYPMAVSPDGSRVVVGALDQRGFQVLAPIVVDLASSSTTAWGGLSDTRAIAAAFAPDGAQLALLVTTGKGPGGAVDLVISDGTAAPRRLAGTTSSGTGEQLEWSPLDVVAPRSLFGYLTDDAVAWQLTG